MRSAWLLPPGMIPPFTKATLRADGRNAEELPLRRDKRTGAKHRHSFALRPLIRAPRPEGENPPLRPRAKRWQARGVGAIRRPTMSNPIPPPQFDHYRVQTKPDGSLWILGRGGMGVTYRAVDTKLGREGALKVVDSNRLQDDAVIERARLAVQRALPLIELIRHASPLLADEAIAA